MTADDVKAKLAREIDLRGYDDQYLDRDEEREILQIALQLGVGVEAARAAMAEACADKGFVLETAVLKVVQAQLELAMKNDGKVDRREFERAFAAAKVEMRGKKSDREIRTLLVTVMEDTGTNKVKTGWFGNWYAALKKDLGLA